MQKLKNVKGITLITLVVTILVLLIVAGVSMKLVMGDNGILSETKETVDNHLFESYREGVEVLRGRPELRNGIDILTGKEYMDLYEEDARKDKKFEEAQIIRKDDETVRIITKEGYVFDVTKTGTRYIGNQVIDPVIDLEPGDI